MINTEYNPMNLPANLPPGAMLRLLKASHGLPQGAMLRGERRPVTATADKPVLHATDDVEALLASAERQAPALGDALKQATAGVPGAKIEAVRDAKDTDRIEDKAARQGVRPSQIGDISAAKVTVPHQQAAEQVLDKLHTKLPVEDVNGTVTGAAGKNHVRQVQATVGLRPKPSEPVKRAEVLLQTPEMVKATDKTHDDYRRAQELRAAGKTNEAAKLEGSLAQTHEQAEQAAQTRLAKGPRTKADAAAGPVAWKPGRQSTPVMVKDADNNWVHGTLDHFNPGFNGQKASARVTLASGFHMRDVSPQLLRKPDEDSPAVMDGTGWIGVDLDATLAHYNGFKGAEHIGPPVPAMVDRVKQWLAEGRDVRIFSARIADDPGGKTQAAIEKWAQKYIGAKLPITNVKDDKMIALYDDRAVQVGRNTGQLQSPEPSLDADPGKATAKTAAPKPEQAPDTVMGSKLLQAFKDAAQRKSGAKSARS